MQDIPIKLEDANFNHLDYKKSTLLSNEKLEQYLRHCEYFSAENKAKFTARQVGEVAS